MLGLVWHGDAIEGNGTEGNDMTHFEGERYDYSWHAGKGWNALARRGGFRRLEAACKARGEPMHVLREAARVDAEWEGKAGEGNV